ncbi:hypothetical protein [Saccharothrix sp. HUAS TT1]|uniref:hypothetical protein n=1 Tax=unclassified Saccharothrix TaxID=2593673 RepID=UPI00345BAD51
MRVRRLVLGAAALVPALWLAALLTGTAAAVPDQWNCAFYLASQGYSGKLVDIGCASGAQGDEVLCLGTLRIAGVPEGLVEEACRRAAEA